MGNCVQERKPQHTLFDAQEWKKLNQVLIIIVIYELILTKIYTFNSKAFEEIFIENAEFGRKLFRFLEEHGEEEKYIHRDVLFYICNYYFIKNSGGSIKGCLICEFIEKLKQGLFSYKLKIIPIYQKQRRITLQENNAKNNDDQSCFYSK
ncbi:unnamed protein product [Paramecium pentaurelia]|uniref:Uncharacterized protein n=1 Tax=Paramecium pentaurelia TaxID=43138 RepID=A0A8S1VAJ2_9CILI|nr:unnamed protein product [Paramecium pentaurelia]